MKTASSAQRYHDIDAARSAVMFFVTAVHASVLYQVINSPLSKNPDKHPFFDWLAAGLHLFVSPAFFLIAGFFCGFLMIRYGAVSFVKQRLLRVGMPMMLIALTFNVFENYLRYRDGGGTAGFVDWFGSDEFLSLFLSDRWQLHIWFLLNLLLFVCVTAAGWMVLRRLQPLPGLLRGAVDWVGRRAQSDIGFLGLLLVIPVFQVMSIVITSVLPDGYGYILGLTSPYIFLMYLVPFLVGVAAYASPALLDGMRYWRWWMLPAAAAAFYFQPYPSDTSGNPLIATADYYLHNLARWTTILFVLQAFYVGFRTRPSAWTAWLSDASFTVYLFHHCLVYVAGLLLIAVPLSPFIEFPLMLLGVIGLLLAFHTYVVKRSPWLRFLLNGKSDVRREPSRAAVA